MSDELPDILGEDLGCLLGWVALEAIVGCEEMQAIKAVLLFHAEEYSLEAIGVSASRRGTLSAWGLPDVVVEWVLS